MSTDEAEQWSWTPSRTAIKVAWDCGYLGILGTGDLELDQQYNYARCEITGLFELDITFEIDSTTVVAKGLDDARNSSRMCEMSSAVGLESLTGGAVAPCAYMSAHN